MKRKRTSIQKLAADAAFVAAITIVNRCLEKNDTVIIKRGVDEKALSRKLSLVNIVYHTIGIFYNE